ncbi:MAG: hypothetical protein IKX14_08375 [Neisseriaceae bacterium]|nr:hypothetical protein [Neisseriaceae bacterium]
MSSEQWLCQALRLDGYNLDNASIYIFRQPKKISKRYLKIICPAIRQDKITAHC